VLRDAGETVYPMGRLVAGDGPATTSLTHLEDAWRG